MFVLVMSLAMLCGMSITAFATEPEPIELYEAGISAHVAPIYRGEEFSSSDFEIEVSLAGETVSNQYYDINFYDSVECSNPVDVVNAGVYYVNATGKDGYTGTTAAIPVKVVKAFCVKPEAVGGLVYDGTEKTGVQNVDTEYMSVSNDKNTEAGTYCATVSLIEPENYCWIGEDNDPADSSSSKPIDIYYAIEPGKGPNVI